MHHISVTLAIVHSFHLAEVPWSISIRALGRTPTSATVSGLVHAECMTTMELGGPLLSPSRARLGQLAVFAEWSDDAALDRFLRDTQLGQSLAGGWHVRLEFMRRWGEVSEFAHLPGSVGEQIQDEPVVAITLARLNLTQVGRFAKWGRPVEELVRDNPDAVLSLAATRPPHTAATFSVWRSLKAMQDMVHGRSPGPSAERHVAAERERQRKDFHREFTTLRFRPVSEFGAWQGKTDIVSRVR